MRLTIHTLDQAALTQAALTLAAQAKAFAPQLVIGIRSGGYVVAQAAMPVWPQARLLPMTCRRASSRRKGSRLKAVLRRLPRAVNDALRIAEHMALTQWRTPLPGFFIPDAQELAAIEAALRECSGARILIVDDAVDSGATLQSVTGLIKSLAPKASIKAAAITVTTKRPLLQPDFFLYRYVLCRFPWALDAR